MAELEIDGQSTVVINESLDVVAKANSIGVDITDNEDLNITINKKEFNIVGDELYIPKRYEDAPEWMQSLIDFTVNFSLDNKIDDINELSKSLEELIDALDVAKNTYEQSIISSADIDQRILTAITTLNSSLREADATILNVAQTATTPDEARAITEEVLRASIDDPDTPNSIGAIIGDIRQVIASGDEANATSVETLEATIRGLDDDIVANAQAIDTLNTEVSDLDGRVTVNASAITDLNAYAKDPNTGIVGGADSQLVQKVETEVSNGVATATSKFAYNSTLQIGDDYYKSGFGLDATATSGTGTEGDPYLSSFWIDASKFKFTNSNATGSMVPFAIDATGAVPKISFNGAVSFTNVTDKDDVVLNADVDANNDDFAKKLGYADYDALVAAATLGNTIITGGYINTDLLEANSIIADNIDTTTLNLRYINFKTDAGFPAKSTVVNLIESSSLNGVGTLTIPLKFYSYNHNDNSITNRAISQDGDVVSCPDHTIASISSASSDTISGTIDIKLGSTVLESVPFTKYSGKPDGTTIIDTSTGFKFSEYINAFTSLYSLRLGYTAGNNLFTLKNLTGDGEVTIELKVTSSTTALPPGQVFNEKSLVQLHRTTI